LTTIITFVNIFHTNILAILIFASYRLMITLYLKYRRIPR